jgi:hypothetical protein
MSEQKTNPSIFTKENYIWMAAGVVLIAIGMLLMAGGKSDNPGVFDDKEVYSTTRITIAPILILAGLVLEVFAIFRKPKILIGGSAILLMNIIEAIIIAVVEGITEFLPISSTGHMIITEHMLGLGLTEADKNFVKLFTVSIQLGAILAVVVLYWRQFFQFRAGSFMQS